ncbi:hypothetical protein HPB48_022520 [Haemaphysalis longicornis]|uniref:Uncharacterized protein n=1 Tax=Haemaphysalis longicornis TaxID=44386 RepID=A0A9J6FSV3_HAELO|nr:hypothetical protein HPB48_022520 [Haemaphysalis longicornis]
MVGRQGVSYAVPPAPRQAKGEEHKYVSEELEMPVFSISNGSGNYKKVSRGRLGLKANKGTVAKLQEIANPRVRLLLRSERRAPLRTAGQPDPAERHDNGQESPRPRGAQATGRSSKQRRVLEEQVPPERRGGEGIIVFPLPKKHGPGEGPGPTQGEGGSSGQAIPTRRGALRTWT